MKIFKKKTAQTSNEYYEAYKAELSGKVETKSFFSLNNILKLEILVVAIGFVMMNQNNLTIELKKMYVAENDVLPVSMQYASLESDLIVELEDTPLKEINIREADNNDMIRTNILDIAEEEAYVENGDIKVLIELLKAEMSNKKASTTANRIIISQK